MAQRLIAGAAALLLALGASSAGQAALAQALADPMQPPKAASQPAADPGKAAPAVQGGAAAPRLQSVLISPNRRLAVIDGNTVPLGGRVGDATLVSITESEAVLVKDNTRETLRLFPGVQKTPVPRPAPPRVTR